MIKIKDTKNMIGITIHGDYEDLRALHKAMSDYLTFYFDHQEGSAAYSCYETMLGLCYDIRHAFQGDRNIESVENNHENVAQLACCIYELDESGIGEERNKYKNGNLYFNVEVLYPWAVFYLFALQAVVEDVYQHEWFVDNKFTYTEYQAEQYLALIQYFVHLLWGKLREHLPEEVMHVLWDHTRICNHAEYYFYYPDMYIIWLCNYWVNAFHDKEQRCDALPLLCLELSSILDEFDEDLEEVIKQAEAQNIKASDKSGDINEEDDSDNDLTSEYDESERKVLQIQASIAETTLHALNLYDRYFLAYNEMQRGNAIPYLGQDEFMATIHTHIREHGQFTEESYDEWLNQEIGEVDWERLEW